jgi:transposase
MLWIAGSMAIVLLGIVLMCILTLGGRADDRMELSNLIEPSISLPFSAEDKIRVVLEGLHNEISVSDLCKREGISSVLYYSWLRDFLEAGKARLRGDSLRNAPLSRVEELKEENALLKVPEWVGGSDPVLEKSLNM